MRKSILCMMLLIVWCANAYSYTGSGGTGTLADPYLVANVSDLEEIRTDSAYTAHFRQTAHIDLTGYNPGDGNGWMPIAGGGTADKFTGSYDGQHYKISNLTINRTATPDIGLFGHIGQGAVIKNVVLDGVDVKGARGTGSLVGRVTGDVTTLIEACAAINGAVVGDAATGGLVGSHNSITETPGGTNNPSISKCYSDINVAMSSATVADKIKFGGLAGCTQKGTILDSYARGSVDTTAATVDNPAARVGGLAGCAEKRGEIIRCYSTGTVIVNANTTLFGGLLGNLTASGGGNDGVVTDSYWDTQTSGQTTSAGGIGKTTIEMTSQSTFINWGFINIWAIDPAKNDGYPYLLWEDLVPEEEITEEIIIKKFQGLNLDGIVDYVTVPHDSSLAVTTNNFVTVSAWVKKNSDQTSDVTILEKGSAYKLHFTDGNQPAFSIVDDADNTVTASSATAIETGKWYHLAGTFDNTTVKIYINGYERGSTGATNGINDDGSPIGIGVNLTTSGEFLHGTIDEVRIRDTARTETQLRDTMCRKLDTGNAADMANVVGYWRFDEGHGLTCVDDSGNGNAGTIHAGARICSAAPIGDASSHDYTAFDTTLSHPDGDSLTAEEYGGTWSSGDFSGIHVYRIDEAPNTTNAPFGINNFGDSPRFWGVFVTGGVNPAYTMTYNYSGYPDISDENSLQIAYRDNNCASWKILNAELDTDTDTLTKTGLTGTQFILGSDVDPRNAIAYDGTDDYVSIPDDNTLDLTTEGTLEAWIYPNSFTAGAGILFKGNASVAYGFGLAGQGAGGVFTGGSSNNIGFVLGAGTDYLLTGSKTLNSSDWYHVACTWEVASDTRAIYLNGIQYAFSTADISGATTTTADDLRFGMQQTDGIYFNGLIDEVRVWDSFRSQSEIRDTMCKKLAGTETGLVSYWRFDRETTDSAVYDYGTDNDGAMAESPGFGSIIDARVCSGAPIGDDSAYGYGTTTAISSASIAHSDGDYLFATQYSGTWNDSYSGLQVYRVDEAPVYPPDIATSPYAYGTVIGLTPPPGWSSIDYYRYWGVYVTDRDNSPTYEVEYHYCATAADTNCNPNVPDDESVLALAKRDDYCDRTWADSGATLDTTNNYLFATGQTGTEYVLGGTNQPLAISLISFIADVDQDKECIDISWETATEVETIGYYLWRSFSRDGEYEKIEASFISAKALDSVHGAKYAYRDCDVYLGEDASYYYKLEEVDMDNTKKNPFYGPIGPVSKYGGADQVTSAKTRSTTSGNSSTCFISTLK